MKNILLGVILLVATTSSLFSQEEDLYSLERLGLKGKVKSIRKIGYMAVVNGDDLKKGSVIEGFKNGFNLLNQEIFYNRNGDKTMMKSFDALGRVKTEETFNYDNSGNIIEEIAKRSSSQIETHTYKYDQSGKLIEDKELYEGGKRYTLRTHSYHENGKTITRISTDFEGIPNSKNIRKYDKWDNLIEEVSTYKGELRFRRISSYNQSQNKTMSKFYDKNDLLKTTRTYKYNQQGKLIEETMPSNTGITIKIVSNYDTRGNRIKAFRYNKLDGTPLNRNYKWIYNANNKMIESQSIGIYGGLIEKFVYEYDEKGTLISKTTILPNGDLKESRITWHNYDTQSNWIGQVFLKNDVPLYIIDRVIEYYN